MRVFSSLSVILFHFTSRFTTDYYQFDSAYPKFLTSFEQGVLLFFILSGYLISISLQRTKSLKDFWIKRFAKIYPTYILCAIITFTVVSLFGLNGREVEVKDLIGNFFFLNQFKIIDSVDGAYWSLIVEVNFYVLIGILFYSTQSLLKSIFTFSIISLSCYALTNYFHFDSLNYFINKIFISRYIGFFMIGSIFYLWETKSLSKLQLLIATPLIIYSIYINHFNKYHLTYIIISILIFMTACLLKNKINSIPKILKILALISYPFYLIHQNIGVIMIRELSYFGFNDHIRIFITFLSIGSISYMLFRFYEDKLNKKIRKKYIIK